MCKTGYFLCNRGYLCKAIRTLPGYTKRAGPGLTASDVAKDAARYLAEYADTEGCPMPYEGRDVGFYLWMQAGRKNLEWDTIVKLVSANRKRDPEKNSARYFGHREVIEEEKGRAEKRDLSRLVRYVVQEGVCSGCQVEFQYGDLTLDRTKPGAAGGEYELSNVTLMCQPCNNAKGSLYGG